MLSSLVDGMGNLAAEANRSGLPVPMKALRAHLRAAAGAAHAAGLLQASWLWNELAYHLKYLAEYQAAQSAYARALEIFQNHLPADHPNLRIVRGNI